MLNSFPTEVAAKLKTYVYRLIDPRNGETFYIGKGKGDRVFSHIQATIKSDKPSDKLKRIRDIRVSGFEVAHVIHRHGLDSKIALEVEAALIDAYPGLTNDQAGFHNDRGAMHAQEIIYRYKAEPAVFKHQAILININRTALEMSVYEATRYAWRISKKKAEQAEIIVAVCQGIIVDVFVAEIWMPATIAHFPNREPVPGRYGFVGTEANDKIRKMYLRKRIPDRYRKKGAANPIKYTY